MSGTNGFLSLFFLISSTSSQRSAQALPATSSLASFKVPPNTCTVCSEPANRMGHTLTVISLTAHKQSPRRPLSLLVSTIMLMSVGKSSGHSSALLGLAFSLSSMIVLPRDCTASAIFLLTGFIGSACKSSKSFALTSLWPSAPKRGQDHSDCFSSELGLFKHFRSRMMLCSRRACSPASASRWAAISKRPAMRAAGCSLKALSYCFSAAFRSSLLALRVDRIVVTKSALIGAYGQNGPRAP
mmetsp:Transcript_29269/g.53940  ORF Transcript_29269/g.53940 Transcript_29269/m.53940 type:complete len:242 (-) Transcript_29269:57-782(-)